MCIFTFAGTRSAAAAGRHISLMDIVFIAISMRDAVILAVLLSLVRYGCCWFSCWRTLLLLFPLILL